jgi:hypothetical protein
MSNCLRVKNPLSPLWNRRVIAEVPYSLIDFKKHVDLNATLPTILIPSRSAPRPDHPDPNPAVAAGSNALFQTLSGWTRQEIHLARAEPGMDEETWRRRVEDHALTICQSSPECWPGGGRDPLKRERAVLNQAKSVAKWTWRNIKPRVAKQHTPKLSPEDKAARQAEAGRNTAQARASRSLNAIVAAAEQLVAQGRTVTQRAVLEIVSSNGGPKSERTIRNHWSAVLAVITGTTGKSLSPIVKEQPTPSLYPSHTSPRAPVSAAAAA